MTYPVNSSEGKDNDTLLSEFNHQMLIRHIPVMVFLTILFIVGSVGNGLSIYIFGCRLKLTTPNFLYACLGVFDLVTCLLGIPVEVVVTCVYQYIESPLLCKLSRYLMHISNAGSMCMLLTIAIDRYLRVCRPLNPQMEVRHAKIGVAITVVAAMISSSSVLLIFGNQTIETPVKGLNSVACNIQDKYIHGFHGIFYHAMLVFAIFFFTVSFAVLYTKMWLDVRRCQVNIARVLPSSSMTPQPSSDRAFDAQSRSSDMKTYFNRLTSLQLTSFKKMRQTIEASRMTMVAFFVTLLFVLSYMPHVGLMIFRKVIGGQEYNLKGAKFPLFTIFLRFYLLNSVGNVFVYSCMCSVFRVEYRRIVGTYCLCSAQVEPEQPSIFIHSEKSGSTCIYHSARRTLE